jgi:Domain of unknown function (DUF1843)
MPDDKQTHPVPLYAVTIHKCAAGGNLAEMKKVEAEAEAHLKSHGNISGALEALKVEIAKLEHHHK